MRRHPALHRLSREHSPALSLARRLMQADTLDGMALAQAGVKRWLSTLLQHFVDEETVLLPVLQHLGETADATRLLADHEQLRMALSRCATAELDAVPVEQAFTSEEWRALGEQLRAHVHFEERHLFPLLEQRLSARQWQAVAMALTPTGES